MQKLIPIILAGLLVFLSDLYVFEAVKLVTANFPQNWHPIISGIYWGWSALTIITLALAILSRGTPPTAFKTYLATVLFIVFAAKLVVMLFLALEDVVRLVRFAVLYFSEDAAGLSQIPRSKVWSLVALVAGFIPFITLIYGIAFGAFRYQVKRVVIKFPNLPPGFHGFKLVQISDLHTGSFSSEGPLRKAVRLINEQEPDVVCFTGDLVNNVADEVQPYIKVLGQIQSKLGVYSVLGNHDYGDYVRWRSSLEKTENLQRLKQSQARMGWRLLMNEHVTLERNGDQIALLGIENWGMKAGFPKYGKMYKAHPGTEKYAFKVLLSHDPSHWEAEINQKYPDVDLMLSGHTHGMQFGVNLPFFKWSPVQYVYKQWSGLYRKGSQYLYVNVGLGYLGYPGRVGFLPEITVLEFHRP